jgi:CubicO group peptidase (beta-lactamase class C family)
VLASDSPRATVEGNSFVGPAGWSLTRRATATILEAPERGSFIALVDVRAGDADAALAAAWAIYKPKVPWPVKVTHPAPNRDGWSDLKSYEYETAPNEKRSVEAGVRRANEVWTVVLYDMDNAVAEKRAGQVSLVLGQLLPKGFSRESFRGKSANALDASRIGELTKFVETSMRVLQVPGVSFGLIQNGKIVFAGGFGVKALGAPAKPDADTLYMVASNTKAMTTMMLAKLVDEKKMSWDTPATKLLPSFKLGDAATTEQVQVKHLICACTGLPRQDMEWLFEFKNQTPQTALQTLGTMQPTSKFGELFQYSNPLAGAAGFIAGHVAFPNFELGAAYDAAMRTRVFEPLGMKRTTFDFAKALRGNVARPHAPDVDGKPAPALMEVNYAIVPVRPAGAAWSNVNDMLRYVQAELGEGTLPNGQKYASKEVIAARKAAQVSIGKDTTYGMGLMVQSRYDVEVVNHGGDLIGFHSDMMWLPAHGVGAVVLTNGDPGWVLRTQFRRKLLEVLFDGRPEAEAQVEAAAKTFYASLEAERKRLTLPADPAESAKLARQYRNDALGEVLVQELGGKTVFDFGEWKSEMASRKNADGTMSFLTVVPGMSGIEFVVGSKNEKRSLVLRDAQHEYAFVEK